MRPILLNYLVCPACRGDLTCAPDAAEGDDIVTGQLACRGCGETYPVRNGIPRMVPRALAVEQKKTADSFGWEWLRFHQLHGMDQYREQFLEWISPLTADAVKGKVVLDAGCGMGRFSAVCSHLGAEQVVAVDLSSAVEAARENTRHLPNVHVVQGDIYNLPLRRGRGDFDFVYSIGVLHHLPDPEAGFHALVHHLKPEGTIFAWVYGYENNEWIVRLVNPIRRSVTTWLPYSALYLLSLTLAVPLHLLIKLLYAPAERVRALSWLKRFLPYKYLFWLSRFGFRHTQCVIFDQLVAPTAFYLKREEFEAWLHRAGLGSISLSWRNENSWRGYGRKVLPSPS